MIINGRERNCNLSYIDWTTAQAINTANSGKTDIGDLIFTQTDCLCTGTLQNTPAGYDNTFYIFKTLHARPSLFSGVTPLSQQLGTRPLYYGARQKTGDSMRDYFKPLSTFDLNPPATGTTLDVTDPDQLIFSALSDSPAPYDQTNVYKTSNNAAIVAAYKVNYNAIAYMQTVNGGLFGASMCRGFNSQNCVLIHSFGAFRYLNALGDGFAHDGNEAYGGKPYQPMFDGQAIIPYPSNEVSYNASAHGSGFTDDKLTDDVSAEFVYTSISGNGYIGLAACKWDHDNISEIQVTLLPEWFFGGYQPPSPDPSDIPQYHGFDAQPDRTSGTYSYTMSDITLPTNPQPFSGMTATEHGLHVYSISQSDYNEILGSLWGDGGLAESLWRKFRNYKFNPIAGVIACHKMPSELMPTSTAIVQVKAAGCPLMSISSAHDITSKAYIDGSSRTISIPKYFSSHLNYDPYSSVQLFLPFCGWMSIPADRVVGGSISVQYRADVVTGNVCAFIRCFDGDGKNTACYQMTGNAALSIPVTGNDNGVGTVLGAVTASAGIAAAALTGGVGGAALIAGAAGAGLATQTARNALQTGTQYSGNVAALGCLQPFVLITLPVEHTSEEYRELHGLPSGIGLTVGQLAGTGYTEMSEFHADFECTESEQAEIERMMKEGVIL